SPDSHCPRALSPRQAAAPGDRSRLDSFRVPQPMPAATDFHLFGPAHLAILIVVPVCAGGLTWITHRKPATDTWTRVTLAALLSLSGLWWYWYRFSVLRMHLPQG